MSEPKDTTHPNSHKDFFAGKKIKASYVEDDADAEELQKALSERDEKQGYRRVEKLSNAVQDALINRVKDATGPDVMRVSYDEFMKMKEDPHFKSFAQYCGLILNYADGRPRPQPLRPFLEHEVGMMGNKIICLANNPGDGARTGAIIGMTSPEEYKRQREAKPIDIAPDPFPAAPSGMRLITDEDE